MVRVFVDTNVLVRYVIQDDIKKFEQVEDFFGAVSRGEVVLYLSSVVLLEMVFVLKSVYKKDIGLIMKVVKKLVKTRGCVLVNKTDLRLALEYLDKYKVKFSDCLIASSIPKGVRVFSYDEDFRKMKLDLFDSRGRGLRSGWCLK